MNSAAPDSGRTRLLMIDDDKKLCRLVTTYLEPLGFDVAAVHTGPEGVERATAPGPAAPHALILDSIAKMVEQVELDDDFHRVADERWAEFLVTGETVSWDEARAYLKARAYGQPTARPVPKKR
jgi:DNA-binding NtrC family response regulator